jgi:uncharacterized RDD family membrane protein YckC
VAFCVRCGAEYAADERMCAKCGSDLPHIPATLTVTTVDLPPASPIKRTLAGTIDGVIAVAIISYFVQNFAPRLLFRSRGALIAGLAVLALPALYLVLRDAFGGKSIGKLLFGITTFNAAKGRVAGVGDSILRNVIFGFVAIPYVGWGLATAIAVVTSVQILSGRPQRWGDGLAHTLVVDDADLRALR